MTARTTTIRVDAARVMNRITLSMYGSCIEDVNHEIYGGLYAQRIFGESFEEPPAGSPMAGWKAYGGHWSILDGALNVEADSGAKLVRNEPEIRDGTVECDVLFRGTAGGNAGLILRVNNPRTGPDSWIGYEVSLSARDKNIHVSRHRDNWQPLKTVPAPVEPGRWHRLRVDLAGTRLSVYLDGKGPYIDVTDGPDAVTSGQVGLRTWQSNAAFRNLTIVTPRGRAEVSMADSGRASPLSQVSGMWDGFHTGNAFAGYAWLDDQSSVNGAHSQRITHGGGSGAVGIANRGLNRWGIPVREGHLYKGSFYFRGGGNHGAIVAALENADGSRTYAMQRILASMDSKGWCRVVFSLRPANTDPTGRFSIWIERAGTIDVDQVYLSETDYALYHGLPVRADIARKLTDQGLTFLRYGGSMVNASEYRWKKMLGDRDHRPPYKGWWYPHSTNGFGIEEFVRFCEAARITPAFAINIDETPEDAADMVEYLNGSASTPWGRKRSENGHPAPYSVRYIEIGNEEAIDGNRDLYLRYLQRFKLLSPAMLAKDPKLQLVIAAWWRPGEPLVKQIAQELRDKAALWDVHVGGDDLREGANVDRIFTQMERLFREWIPGSPLKACVFEENGDRHDLQRALGHAYILNVTQRHGDFILMDCPANCLQPLGQNDNGWNQGQVFFTPDRVWGMAPYYAQQMASANHLPLRVASEVSGEVGGGAGGLDVTATRSEDGRTLILKVVNRCPAINRASIEISGFQKPRSQAEVWTLAGHLKAFNAPGEPERIRSVKSTFGQAAERFSYTFPAYSYTILRLRR